MPVREAYSVRRVSRVTQGYRCRMKSSTSILRLTNNQAQTAALSLMSASAGAILAGASFMAMALGQTAEDTLLRQAYIICFICGLLFACTSVIWSGVASRQATQRAVHVFALGLGALTLLAYLYAFI